MTKTMENDWVWDNIRQVHVDFHMPEFPKEAIKHFDAKTFVSNFVEANVNVIGIFTKCHFGNAFYPTEVGHKHGGLVGDFFGEVLEEAHKHEIKVIAYYSLGTDAYAVQQNPDWYQIDVNGNVRGAAGTVWELPCINSPYREELVIPQIREITEKYDMDGYLFDIPYLSGHNCFCPYCKKKFNEEYNLELTPSLYRENPELVRSFAVDSAARTMQELHDLVKSIKPHVLMNCNGAWKMGEPDSINSTSDFGLWESQPAAGTFLIHSIKARYTRTLNVPVQIMTVRFTEDWGMMSCKTTEQLKYEMASIIANGGIPNIGDQVLPSGELQSGVYTILGEVFHFVKERETYCIRSSSKRHIALIANNTSNWLWDEGDPALFGAAKMLIEGHQQFDIYYNDQFTDLQGYKTVILSETVQLSEESLERIRTFVRKGGLLLATGEATWNREKKDFELSDVFGVRYLDRTPYEFGYLTESDEVWDDVPRIPQLVKTSFLKVVSTTARMISEIRWPLTVPAPNRAFRYPIPPAGNFSGLPGISVNDYGEGKALYLSAPVFTSYWNTNHYWVGRIVNNLLNLYDKEKPFTIEAPPQVEANLMEKNGRYYLHLIQFQHNHSGNRKESSYEPIEKIWPIQGINIAVRRTDIKTLRLLPEDIDLPYTVTDDGMVNFVVPHLHIHAIIEIS